MLRNFAMSLGVGALAGAAFGWVAWQVGRRWGTSAITVLWATTAVALTVIMAAWAIDTMAARGWTSEQQQRIPLFRWFLAMWGIPLWLVARSALRGVRSGVGRYTLGLAARSAGAWLLGVVVFFVVFALADFADLL